MSKKMSAEEKRWRAKDDARTLAEAAVIKADKVRAKAARSSARELADEQQIKAQAMRRIAGSAPGKSRSKPKYPETTREI